MVNGKGKTYKTKSIRKFFFTLFKGYKCNKLKQTSKASNFTKWNLTRHDDCKAWFSYAAEAPATWPPVLTWDTFPIWEQKWPATLVIPVLIAGMPAKLTRVTSQIYRQHMTTRLNCVFSFPVNQFEIYFPGLLWEIVFGVTTENWLHLIASPSPSFPPYFFLALEAVMAQE